jgi:hypothetical protein
MRISIEIGHPAHVFHFKNLIIKLKENNHDVLVFAKNKEISHYLLRQFNIEFVSIGQNKSSFLKKIKNMFSASFIMYKVCKKLPPDLFISRVSPVSGIVSLLLRKPHIAFNDTENAHLLDFFSVPLVDAMLVGESFERNFGKKQIQYPGYHELAYLHPSLYKPNPSIFNFLKIPQGSKYAILRFVSWNAHHDIGHKGISLKTKLSAVNYLENEMSVFISSEKDLEPELTKYKINIPPELMHDALNYASVFYGESATMASECACLGTPAIFIDNDGRGYTNEQEKRYGIVSNFSESEPDQLCSLNRLKEIINNPRSKDDAVIISKQIVTEKINVPLFMVWVAENYSYVIKLAKGKSDQEKNITAFM